VAINPQSAGSHNNLGRALGERGDLTGAAAQFEAALTLQSGPALAHRNLALIELRRGNIRAAIDHLKRSIQIMEANYEDVSADRRELVRWLASQQRWPEVIEQLQRAQRAAPNNPDIARLLDEAKRRATTVPASAPTTTPIK
jgi:tetratricopeptide (TPR) repeat protein